MSAARLPYYQQDQEDGHQRRAGRGHQRGYYERGSVSGSYRRERGRYSRSRSRSRSRSAERSGQRRRRQERQSSRYHRDRDSRDRSRDRSRDPSIDRSRDRERDHSRRSSHYRRSESPAYSGPGPSGSSNSQRRGHHASLSSKSDLSVVQKTAATAAGATDQVQLTGKSSAASAVGAYYNLDTDEPFDKERIHREMEQKLREALAREGKVYPPPKPEPPSHPVFANDGSFMELFKKMQEGQKEHASSQLVQPAVEELMQQQFVSPEASSAPALPAIAVGAASSAAAPYIAAAAAGKLAPPPPIVGRRRGGKVLKTGVVAKVKTPNESDVDPKDFWSLYLAEVNKYKSNACDTDNGKRPLVK